jgi:hypothetical protein
MRQKTIPHAPRRESQLGRKHPLSPASTLASIALLGAATILLAGCGKEPLAQIKQAVPRLRSKIAASRKWTPR